MSVSGGFEVVALILRFFEVQRFKNKKVIVKNKKELSAKSYLDIDL